MAAIQPGLPEQAQIYDAPEVVHSSTYRSYQAPPPTPSKSDLSAYGTSFQAPYVAQPPQSIQSSPSSAGPGGYVGKEAPQKRTVCGLGMTTFLLIIIGMLSASTIALGAVAGLGFSRANTATTALAAAQANNSTISLVASNITSTCQSNSTSSSNNTLILTSANVSIATDSGCRTDPASVNGSNYVALSSGVFQRFCGLDSGGNDLLDIISPSFEACIEACAIWNVRLKSNGANVTTCTGIAFVPAWYNTTGRASGAPAIGDCFLKRNITRAKLSTPNPPTLVVHAAIFIQ